MEENTNRAEAERLLGIAEKLLQGRDLSGSRDFAVLAQESEPLLEGSDQIIAVTDVLLAAQKRINNHHDWYAILGIDRRSDDHSLIKKQYRRLALLLHPDKNRYAFADIAFKLVADAWAVFSDSGKKSLYDNEFGLFTKVDLVAMRKQKEFEQRPNDLQQQKFPVKRGLDGNPIGNNNTSEGDGGSARVSSFWTACPYCYNLYEYPGVYTDCCLKCQNCQRAFHGSQISSLPPLVPGKEEYYCCWGFFPLGFVIAKSEGQKKGGFPNWMPAGTTGTEGGNGFGNVSEGRANLAETVTKKRGRGRPRKYV